MCETASSVNGQCHNRVSDHAMAATAIAALLGAWLLTTPAAETSAQAGLPDYHDVGVPQKRYYVSPSGKDTNPGTQHSPWRTIQHAVKRAGPGTGIYVREGTYAEEVTIAASGSPGRYMSSESGPNALSAPSSTTSFARPARAPPAAPSARSGTRPARRSGAIPSAGPVTSHPSRDHDLVGTPPLSLLPNARERGRG